MSIGSQKNLDAAWIDHLIKDFVETSPENSLKNDSGEKAWDTPLVGFSRGDDALYEFLKKDIGPFYWTPMDIFLRTFPDAAVSPDGLTVLSWVLPQTKQTKADHRQQRDMPSERWSRSRFFGEAFNRALRSHVVDSLAGNGILSVAPMLSLSWERKTSEKYGVASTWSERHTAHICGLGTFGLSDGLITSLGKAVRFGSVVAQMAVPPTRRPYSDHQTFCLYYANGTCGQCIDRCPAGAITEQGHDKETCKKYLRETCGPFIESRYGFKGKGCGLCQTGVPCESRIPVSQ